LGRVPSVAPLLILILCVLVMQMQTRSADEPMTIFSEPRLPLAAACCLRCCPRCSLFTLSLAVHAQSRVCRADTRRKKGDGPSAALLAVRVVPRFILHQPRIRDAEPMSRPRSNALELDLISNT
jgi:hypothetical protein